MSGPYAIRVARPGALAMLPLVGRAANALFRATPSEQESARSSRMVAWSRAGRTSPVSPSSVTSRNASSIELCSTSGVSRCSRSITCCEAARQAEKFGGTTISSHQGKRRTQNTSQAS
jgi:hypothetical protein